MKTGNRKRKIRRGFYFNDKEAAMFDFICDQLGAENGGDGLRQMMIYILTKEKGWSLEFTKYCRRLKNEQKIAK